jgi:hypothetical protein
MVLNVVAPEVILPCDLPTWSAIQAREDKDSTKFLFDHDMLQTFFFPHLVPVQV